MADEVASLKVLITGDASDLQSAIQKTEAELLGMNKAVAGANKLSETSQKAFNKVTASTKTYRDSVNEAKTALDKQRTAFKDSTDAYKQNTKDITNNIRGLKQQKTALEGAIVSKNDEIKALESSNKAINKNSSEYKNNQKAIQWVKNEQATLKEQYAQVTSDIDKQSTALKKERTARNAARRDLKQSTADYEEMSSHLKDVERQEKALNRQITGAGLKQLGDDLDTITKPLQVGAAAMAAGGVAAVKFAMDYETAFTGVKKTVNGTDAELKKLNGDIRQMALEVPVSAKELANLAAIGGQLGVGVNDISKFTETIAAMGVATNLAGEEGASALARFINVTGESLDNVDRIGSTIVALGNNSATTEREIADMAVRMGKFGNTVGINAQQVLGYSAALSSMGVEAQAGGSAIGRIWLGIEEAVSSGGEALSAYAKYSGKTAEEFRNQWSTDASGAFKGLIEGLHATEDLTGAMSELGVNNTLDIQSLMALANGYETLEKSLSLASTAYAENTALTKEAEAAYATTASQIQLAKNNLVESAMGFGELLLPSVVNATGGIKEFAQGLANMDEAQKQGLITTGKWVIGLGATAKVTTGAIKGIGSTMQAMGSIKEAISAGGVLEKFGPALTAIGSTAPYAVAGIAAVGGAVYLGKKAYDAWYDSQYRFAKGLSEGNAAIRKHTTNLNALKSAQSQIEAAKLVIQNPDSSQADVENARAQIENIAEMLAEEYDLHINVDAPDLPEAVESIEKAVEVQSANEWSKLQRDINKQLRDGANARSTATRNKDHIEDLRQQRESAIEARQGYESLGTQLDTLRTNYQYNGLEQSKYQEGLMELGRQAGLSEESLARLNEGGLIQFDAAVIGAITDNFNKATKAAEVYSGKISDYDANVQQLSAEMTSTANQILENAGNYAADGNLEQFFINMRSAIEAGKLDLEGYAVAAQNTLSGMSLETAMQKGGNDLTNWINGYIGVCKEFGGETSKAVAKAALFKNSLTDVSQVNDGNIKKVVSSIAELGKAQGIDMTAEKITEFAKSIGLLENSHIEITADGDFSIVEDTIKKVKELESSNGVNISVNAEGNIDILSEAGNTIADVNGQAAFVSVNAQGNIDVLNAAGQKIAEIDGMTGTVTLNTVDNTTTEAEAAIEAVEGVPESKETTISESGASNVAAQASNVSSAVNSIPTSRHITITASFPTLPQLADGTSDAPGGLAMINDERGTSDPRELVEVGGKGYIFEGKDVVLPLPKHAKVYTADQTKAIMAGKGIPHYARGHQNDAWDAAQDDWRHYTTVNNVSASEALKHWDAMLEKFKNDAEVVKEIQEEIVASTKDLWNEELDAMQFSLDMGWISQEEYYERLWRYRDENFKVGTQEWKDATLELHKWEEECADEAKRLAREQLNTANAASEAWVKTTNYLDSWEKQGDSMLGAYVRFRDRNLQAVQEGVQTEQEAYRDNFSFMETMLEDRLDTAMSAMDREARVWGLSSDAQLAEINKLRDEYSAFFDSLGTLTDDQLVLKMKIDAQLEDETFDVIGKKISKWEQSAALYMRESQTLGWDWKNKGDSEAAYYLRMQKEYQRLLDDGGLNAEMYEEYQTKMREAELDAYAAASTQFDEMLSQKMDEINEMQTTLSDKVSNLREKWSTEDRQEDIRDVKEQLSIYENAVTKEGREEYERLQEQLKQLERDEQIFQMEKDNNRIIAQMERAYAKLEDDKSKQIEDILSNASAFNSTMESDVPDILKEASVVSSAMNESLKPDVDAVKNALTNSENGLPGICDAIVSFRKGLVEAVEKIDFNVDINNTFEVDEDNIFGKFINSFARGVASKWGGR